MKKSLIVLGIAMLLIMRICLNVFADFPGTKKEITEEDLFFMEIPIVITATKKEQKQFETAAATYVITKEDIRRSGATTIPELLRMVPGLNVAHIDANKWAISSRGFNGRFANKLLVMIDGRSVYTPLFSGVYWDVQDTLLQDIDRIEVIRGPGSILWGANAVNGVINIITKHAKDSQGGLVHAGTGDREHGLGALRYGDKLGKDAYFRVYAKYFNRDDFVEDAHDRWQALRGGLRLDWDISENNTLTVLGDLYDGESDQNLFVTSLSPPANLQVADTENVNGGNMLVRWKYQLPNETDMVLQAYVNNAERDNEVLDQRINTYDIDFMHRFPWGNLQEITWGLGYRLVKDKLHSTFTVSFDREGRYKQIFSAFLQDEIKLRENLRFYVGSKFEHNDYSGFEIQPGARFLWQPAQRHVLWGAVSRAVRTPSRSNSDIRINAAVFPGFGGLSSVLAFFGDLDFESEDLLAYEIGYRHKLTKNISIDLTAFYNQYDDLLSSETEIPFFETTPLSTHLILPTRFDNLLDGETYGIEVSVNWQITKKWKLSPSYTFLDMEMHTDSASNDINRADSIEKSNPEHQFQIHSYLDLPYNLELDTALYYVSELHNIDVSSYTRLDMRLGWLPRDDLELSLSVQNLLDGRHLEFPVVEDVAGSEVPRSFSVGITWRH